MRFNIEREQDRGSAAPEYRRDVLVHINSSFSQYKKREKKLLKGYLVPACISAWWSQEEARSCIAIYLDYLHASRDLNGVPVCSG